MCWAAARGLSAAAPAPSNGTLPATKWRRLRRAMTEIMACLNHRRQRLARQRPTTSATFVHAGTVLPAAGLVDRTRSLRPFFFLTRPATQPALSSAFFAAASLRPLSLGTLHGTATRPQLGSASCPVVRRETAPPPAGTANRPRAPSRSLTKAIVAPDGDQVGCSSGVPSSSMMSVLPLPSGFITQISDAPLLECLQMLK